MTPIILLIFLFSGVSALSLDEYINRLFEISEVIGISDREQQQSLLKIHESRSALFPGLFANSSYIIQTDPPAHLPSQRFSWGLAIRQTLWDGRSSINAYRQATLQSQFQICLWQQSYMQVKAEGTILYNRVILLNNLLDIQEHQVERREENHRQTRELFQLGMRRELDTLQSYIALKEAERERNSAKESRNNARRELLLSIDKKIHPDSLVLTTEQKLEIYPFSLEEILEKALSENKEIRGLESANEVAKLNLQRIRGAYSPHIFAQSEWRNNTQWANSHPRATDKSHNIGLFIEYELISFNRRPSQVASAQFNLEITELNLKRAIRNLTLLIEENYSTLKQREISYLDAATVKERAEKAYEIALHSYEAGVISQLELMEHEETLMRSNFAEANALFEYNKALIQLRLLTADYLYEVSNY